MNEINDDLLYRFKSLIHAIEFFSQRFEIEQIIEYAIDFTDQLLMVDQMVVYTQEDGQYIAVSQRQYPYSDFSFEVTPAYEDIVVLHAGLFHSEDINVLLPEKISELYPCKIGIPLIMDKKMFGFILLNRRGNNNEFSPTDEMIALALMNLFYMALTNYESYAMIIDVQQQLDEKIFNLYAMNQSSKVLMATTDISVICSLATSIYSELTQSSITTIFIGEEGSIGYVLKAHRNVFEQEEAYDIKLYPKDEFDSISDLPYYDLRQAKDLDKLKRCFYNIEDLMANVDVFYLVPIKKYDEVLGFVTLSKRVNDLPYNDSVLELAESLSTALFIALANSVHIQTIQQQKTVIDSKLDNLVKMNLLIKTINGSTNFENLAEIIKSTLEWSYNVSCGLLASYQELNEQFKIESTIHMESYPSYLKLSRVVAQLKKGKMVIANSINETNDLLGTGITQSLTGLYSGAMLIPIYIDGYETELLGVMIIFDVEDMILSNPINQLTFESLSHAIAPAWQQLTQLDELKRTFDQGGIASFRQLLNKTMDESHGFDVPLHLILVTFKSSHFFAESPVLLEMNATYKKSRMVDNHHLAILTHNLDDLMLVESQVGHDHTIEVLTYGKNFLDFDSLVSNFED